MAIPYRTTKFKSPNILATAILGSTAKFNSHQYFRLYGIFHFCKRGLCVYVIECSFCFQDVFIECEDSYGPIEEMNICDNLGDHLVGNIYIKVRWS